MSDKVVGGDAVTVVRDWVEDKLGDTSAQNDAVVAAINALSDKPLNGAGLAVLRDWINARIASIPTGPDLDESTADATAVASDISDGKTAYVKGVKVTGTLPDVVGVNLYQSGSILSGIGDIPNGSGGSDFVNRTTIAGTMTNDRILREGARVSIVTASSLFGDADPSDVLAGKTFTAKDGKETGTIATKSASDLTASGPTVSVPAGYFPSPVSKSVATTEQATPTATINNSTGIVTASATQGEGYVTAGTKSSTIQLSTQGAATVTPGTSDKTAVAANKFTTGAVTVSGDGNLVSSNIKSGVTIFGVTGNVTEGINTSDATATASDILSGKTAYINGSKITGTIATKTSSDMITVGATVTAPAGYYASNQSKSVSAATQATPSASINNSTGIVTASATQTAGYVSAGTKSSTLQLTTQAAQTITPGTSNKTISANRWLKGTQTIKGDSNLIATNIKSGVSIFGVTGTVQEGVDTSDATATAEDISNGKTAYVDGVKVTGSASILETITVTFKTGDDFQASLNVYYADSSTGTGGATAIIRPYGGGTTTISVPINSVVVIIQPDLFFTYNKLRLSGDNYTELINQAFVTEDGYMHRYCAIVLKSAGTISIR